MIIAEIPNSGKDIARQDPARRCRPNLFHWYSAPLLCSSSHGENVFVDNALIN
jgi:hypothetical protein